MKMSRNRRGVAMLVVLMVILGLIILGQSAMLWLDRVAQSSGLYRRQEGGAYCAEEGLNLGRAWILQQMGTAPQINPLILNPLLADPANPADLALATKDLCQIAGLPLPGVGVITGLAALCRLDPQTGAPMYRINLIDDIDEPPPTPNPFLDTDNVFLVRAECIRPALEFKVQQNGATVQTTDVAMVEINQAGGPGCFGPGNAAGCGMSHRAIKRDIEYLSDKDLSEAEQAVRQIPLARFNYKWDAPTERRRLGFIIEDVAPSPSVDEAHGVVDLYAYTSLAVAALQEQSKEIARLRQQVDELQSRLGGPKHQRPAPLR
jgi:hypothetical protein